MSRHRRCEWCPSTEPVVESGWEYTALEPNYTAWHTCVRCRTEYSELVPWTPDE